MPKNTKQIKHTKLNQSGLAHLFYPLLGLLVIAAIGGAGYYVYQQNKSGAGSVSSRAGDPPTDVTLEAENFHIGPAPAVPSGPKTLNPTDDTWVDSSKPEAIHGRDTVLKTVSSDGFFSNQQIYLKFDLSKIPKSVYSAKLRIKVANPAGQAISVQKSYRNQGIDLTSLTPWRENTLNYTNRPPFTFTLAKLNAPQASSDGWVEADITNHAQLSYGQEMAVAVTNSSGSSIPVSFYSKESAYKPELKLTFAGSPTAQVYPINEAAASGGKVLKFYGNGSASANFSTARTSALKIDFFGRAEQCSNGNSSIDGIGAEPVIKAKIDGKFLYYNNIGYGSTFYSQVIVLQRTDYYLPELLLAGNHTIEISYPNDLPVVSGCDRNLVVDKLHITTYPASSNANAQARSDTTTPPAPTPAPGQPAETPRQ